MSCLDETQCAEPLKRRVALAILGLMALIFLALSFLSFIPARNQALPAAVQFDDETAIYGKRVFQAYNCMGCHTIVGNGAYFAPDLTFTYQQTGPAWLAAFLPSAAGWPTAAAVQVQLQNPAIAAKAGTDDMQSYRSRYPGAHERMERRGGHPTLMPNLPLDAREIRGLLAFLEYTSSMNTEGWPPTPQVDGIILRAADHAVKPGLLPNAAAAPTDGNGPVASDMDPAALGAKLVADLGCTACHATDEKRLVGPGWGGRYGSEVTLQDGSRIVVDEAYIIESITDPDVRIAQGYSAGVMPSYKTLLDDSDMNAIVAYLRSLGGK